MRHFDCGVFFSMKYIFAYRYYYKFCVDGVWCYDESQRVMVSKTDVKANVQSVNHEDREVFEALACDSFAVKSRKPSIYSDEWSQQKPVYDGILPLRDSHPPFLPQHLSQNMLNKNTLVTTVDPIILPAPVSHVTFEHLYAQSIKDNLLVLASTTRYKKKCVTVIYYRPID